MRPVRAFSRSQQDVFVLGAYPSALHVRWHMPGNLGVIKAVAIGDEPEPFWSGHNQEELIAEWCRDINFDNSWGRAEACGTLNGSSGLWLEKNVLDPLGIARTDTWITDCIDTYFMSTGAAIRFDDPVIRHALVEFGIAPPRHRRHPSEHEIVKEALALHATRLLNELGAARPKLVVTLGNAALRVLRSLTGGGDRHKLNSSADLYGRKFLAEVGGNSFEVLPLAHPAAPQAYQSAHGEWCARLKY